MTIEVYDGPGSEDYRSTMYSAVHDTGDAAYVYGVANLAKWASLIAVAGGTITANWIKFGTDSASELTVTRIAGAITSVVIYPKHLDIDYTITGSTILITVPADTDLLVEFNGEQAKPLMIFAKGLKANLADGNPVDTFTNVGTFPAATGGRTLYFGPGVHTIGQLYDVPTGARVYLDGGAWVIGSFDVRSSDNWTIEGPGHLSGEWVDGYTLDRNQTFAALALYSMILGRDGADFDYSNNQVRDITLVATPFYGVLQGANHVVDMQMVSMWWQNTDGVDVRPDLSLTGDGEGSPSTVSNCFFYVGDDALKFIENQGDKTADGNFCVNTAASAILLGYTTDATTPGNTTITNTTVISKANDYYPSGAAGPNNASHIKLWMDGTLAGTNTRRVITIDGLTAEGAGVAPLFTIENLLYPWGTQRDAAGNAYNITISDVTVETNPGERSRLKGLSLVDTPHDITFTGIYIAGTLVHEGNWDTYVDQNDYPYDITLDAEPEAVPTSTFVVEDGTGLSTANSYCSVADADVYHDNQGSPAAWTAATTNQKREALRIATTFLDYHYGARWAGIRGSSEQALDWPRSWVTDSAGNTIDSDVIPTRLELSCAVAALLHIQGETLLPQVQTTTGIASESNTVGAVTRTVTYRGSKPASALFPIIERMMSTAGLLVSGSSGWGITLA